MPPNPLLGVVFHWLGGLASGSFYVPYRFVKRWSWETYWLVGGVFSWIIAPWVFAFFLTRNLPAVLAGTPPRTWFFCILFGLMWGVGGLTFGLTMRYLGLSLGMAIVLGLCAAFGTLVPPIFNGTFMSEVLGTSSGRVILLGVFVCLAGIGFAGLAGIYKEREMSTDQQRAAIQEFDLRKGFLVAVLSGVMSACFKYGLDAGGAMKTLTIQQGTSPLWQGLPVLIVVLIGGFATNFIWTLYLHIRNRTGHEYLAKELPAVSAVSAGGPQPVEDTALNGPTAAVFAHTVTEILPETVRVPRLRNYVLCAVAGVTWYLQFFFYSMGETKMGIYTFSSWSLHMASIVIFSTLWGLGLHEWRGASRKPMRLLFLALATLIGSTLIIGYGNYLSTPVH